MTYYQYIIKRSPKHQAELRERMLEEMKYNQFIIDLEKTIKPLSLTPWIFRFQDRELNDE